MLLKLSISLSESLEQSSITQQSTPTTYICSTQKSHHSDGSLTDSSQKDPSQKEEFDVRTPDDF
ncbi:unnamed protein product [Moneuplotes crassus]|uniref:Uncharacterized protein n=1 Tax=Euplotes crassus TaxID=5936 RepID=A0AAD1XBN1_EUPCR|nr:unnamed protein product [Moneuplotes crassus]